MERFSVLRTDLLPKVPGAHSSEYRLSFETCCDGFLLPSCTLSSYFPEAGVGAECAVIGVLRHHSSILAFCTPLEPFEFDKVSLGSGYFAKYLRLFGDYNVKPRLTQVCHFPNNF